MVIGLETQFELLKSKLKSKADVIVAVLHSFLLYNGYSLIGLGNVEVKINLVNSVSFSLIVQFFDRKQTIQLAQNYY